jgi:hypothetical protein
MPPTTVLNVFQLSFRRRHQRDLLQFARGSTELDAYPLVLSHLNTRKGNLVRNATLYPSQGQESKD